MVFLQQDLETSLLEIPLQLLLPNLNPILLPFMVNETLLMHTAYYNHGGRKEWLMVITV